jgi:aldehyde dehydrogenase (NAD+)
MANVENLVGGRAVPALSGERMDNLCPADGSLIGTAPRSAAGDAVAAIAAAEAAFPAWADTPAPVRGDALLRLARVIEGRAEELSRALALEEGKIIAEARGEVQKALRYVLFAAGDGRRMTGITAPSELAGTFAFTMWRPHGVVGLITPWNFPVCIPLWKLAPALVAGNTVVLKPAPETPWTAALIGEMVQEAGIPAGVVNIVHGDAAPAIAIIEHPAVKAISFTGSTDVGLAIEAACGRLHKLVQCELGGKNPIIVLDDADLESAATACAQGAFGSTGQRCTATSRAIVDAKVANTFVELIVAKAEMIVPGHPLTEGVSMGPSVSERQMEKVLSYHSVARDDGATIRIGGQRAGGSCASGYFPLPTVYDNVRANARVATEEIFGPVLSVIRVGDVDEAIAAANAVDFGLTSSVYTRDLGRAFRMIERLDTGMTQINAPTMGGEGHLPFGGIKKTGVGPREMGPDAWKFYSESKTVYINHGGGVRTSKFY